MTQGAPPQAKQVPSYHITQDMEITPPEKATAFPITHREWFSLKSAVSCIEDSNNVFHTAGSTLLGAGLSTVITALLTNFQSGQEKQQIIMWSAAIICLLCGSLSMYFGHKEKGLVKKSAAQVLSQMEIIEERWPQKA